MKFSVFLYFSIDYPVKTLYSSLKGGEFMSVGSRMKERREALGMTQVQLADLLGVTKGAIGNYETGANSPKASILYKVFEVLKCDANYLFQDEMRGSMEDNLNPQEIDIIKKYRALDERGRSAVMAVLDHEYNSTLGEKADLLSHGA